MSTLPFFSISIGFAFQHTPGLRVVVQVISTPDEPFTHIGAAVAGAAQIEGASRVQTLNLGGSATTIASFVVGRS